MTLPTSSADQPRAAARTRRRGFTLVEMLVVLGIITVLFATVLLVGRGVLDSVKLRTTENMLQQVTAAIREFANEDPYGGINPARKRYRAYPPDDLMAYTAGSRYGNPPQNIGMSNLMSGGIGGYVRVGLSGPVSDHPEHANYVPQGSIKALVRGLRSVSGSRGLLDGISEQFKVVAPIEQEFFDLNGNGAFDSAVDQEVQYLVDVWGSPVAYYSAHYDQNRPDDPPSAHGWVAQRLVQANSGLPVVMSYGPDGEVQLDADKTLEQQYINNVLGGQGSSGGPVFDSPFNDDDLYTDRAIPERLQNVLVP